MPDVVREYFGVMVTTILGMILGYISRVMFVRLSDPTSYGTFYSGVYISGIIVNLFFSGIPLAIINKISSSKNTKDKARKAGVGVFTLIIPIVASFVFYLFKPPVDVSPNIFVILVSSLSISMLVKSIFQGNGRIAEGSLIDIFRPFSMMLSLLFIGRGIQTVLLAYSSFILASSIGFFIAIKPGPISFPSKKDFIDVIKYAVPIFITATSLTLFNQLDGVLLTIFRSVREVGLYEMADPIANIIKYLVSPISIVLFPIISNLYSRKKDISDISTSFLRISFLISIPVTLVVFSFPDIIVNIAFSSKYLEIVPTIRILSLSAIFWSLFTMNSSIISGMGKPDIPTKISHFFGLLNTFLDFFVVPVFGYFGAAFTTLLAGFGSFLYSTQYLIRHKVYRTNLIKIAEAFVPGIFSFISIWISKHVITLPVFVEIFVVGLIGSVVYVISLKGFRIIKKDEAVKLANYLGPIGKLVIWLAS